MQQIPAAYLTAMKRSHHINTPRPYVIAEFNFNAFVETTVTNGGQANKDSQWPYNWDYFPVESVASAWRPTAGIQYAITDQSYTTTTGGVGIDSIRAYTVDKGSVYKYWVSPAMSQANPAGNTYAIELCKPTVIYAETVRVNKLRAVFAMDAVPKSFTLEYTVNGTTWIAAGTNPAINQTTGVCELWWTGSSWSATQQFNEATYLQLKGVRVVVNTVDRPMRQCGIIEVSARREIDLTERVEDFAFTFDMGEVDYIHPVGIISSNSGSVTINNYDKAMSETDATSPYYGILDRRCEIRAYVDYDLSEFGGVSSYKARVATMYTNMWAMENEWSYSLELFDCAKELQQMDCPAIFVQNVSITQLVSRILDTAGFNNYQFQASDFKESTMVSYFWTDGTETFWEVLQSLCKSTQSALWVDEFGMIQLATRTEIADETLPIQWTFLWQENGLDIPDIITLKRAYDIQANDVTIKYNKMEPKTDLIDLSGTVLTDILWESQDTVVLRATPIVKDIPADTDNVSIWISPEAASRWPYTGKINIDGELFEIEGKGYGYWTNQTTSGGGTYSEKKILTNDEKRVVDLDTYKSNNSQSDIYGRENKFTGQLYVKERDLEKAGKTLHSTRFVEGWAGCEIWQGKRTVGQYSSQDNRYFSAGTNARPIGTWRTKTNWTAAQRRWTWKDSVLSVDSNGMGTWESQPGYVRVFDTSEYREFGTRIRFGKGYGDAAILVAITNFDGFDTGDGGVDPNANWHRYMAVHLMKTESVDQIGRPHGEIWCEYKHGDTNTKMPTFGLGSEESRRAGASALIVPGVWYDLEVIHNDFGHYDGKACSTIEVFLNGQYMTTFYVYAKTRQTNIGGIMVRGANTTEFEHFFATTVKDQMSTINADQQDFNAFTVQLPAGTNQKKMINLPPQGSWLNNVVVAMITTGSAATIHKMTLTVANKASKELGSFTLQPDKRPYWELPYIGGKIEGMYLEYSSANDISVTVETSSRIQAYLPFGYNAPNDDQIYDIDNGGYISNKWNAGISGGSDPNSAWSYTSFGVIGSSRYIPRRKIFFDDFGAYAHEIRDFDVELSKAPGISTKTYTSNEKVKIISETYNPSRGIFTLANASRRDEIVSGTEQITDADSIDHTIFVYGYILQDKGEATKNVVNEKAVRNRGRVKVDLDADWVHNEAEAEALANWIVEHWSEPMDVIDLEVFANTFSQVGDKVKVKYDGSNVDPNWVFVIHEITRQFTEDGLKSTLTLHRVR